MLVFVAGQQDLEMSQIQHTSLGNWFLKTADYSLRCCEDCIFAENLVKNDFWVVGEYPPRVCRLEGFTRERKKIESYQAGASQVLK